MKTKYLSVRYGDNDFMNEVQEALKRLWTFIRDNHPECDRFHKSGVFPKVPEVFISLNQRELLHDMIARLIDVEYIAGRVEFSTRGAHRPDQPLQRELPKLPLESATKDLLRPLKIKFHTDVKFSEEWDNSESAAIDLITGYIWTF